MDNYLMLVLEHGGDVNQEDLSGRTPLFAAVFTRRVAKKIRLLLDAGADINHRDCQGATAVARASSVAFSRSSDSALALLDAGADYRIPGDKGFDLILVLAREALWREEGDGDAYDQWASANVQPLVDRLTKEGVNWKAARAAVKSPETLSNLKALPADYKHRPWLPQRPTLKKPDVEPPKT